MKRSGNIDTLKEKESMYNLEGRNVLVAGGAGFVGSTLVRLLLEKQSNVVVYDNFLHGVKQNLTEIQDRITIIPGDILDAPMFMKALKENDIDYVFHCVGDAFVPTTYNFPQRALEINVGGTLKVLMMSKQMSVKRVLYVSSTEVYGEALKPKIDEDHPLLPLNTYAVTKLAADRLCYTLFLEHDIPVITARIFNTFGPRDTQPRVIPDIIYQLSRSNVVELGNVEAERDFVYVEDTARGLITLMESRIPNGEAVNIGTGKSWKIREVAEIVGDIMGYNEVKIRTTPERLRKLDIEKFCCDPTKIFTETDWRPKISFREGIQRTIDWFNSNGKVWSWVDFSNGALQLK